MPENTVPAFLKAIELGVDTVELDVVVSQDYQLVVSHESPFLLTVTLGLDGKPILADKQTQFNLFKLNYAEIRRYDVGSKGSKTFRPNRESRPTNPR